MAEKTNVVTLMSDSWSKTPRISARKLSAEGSPGMPSTLGSWPAATVRPTPTLMPVSVEAVSTATVDVVLTDNVRDPPSRA